MRIGTSAIFAALLMLLLFPATAMAGIAVVIDGTSVIFDVPPRLEEGRTLVPFRAILQSLGAGVEWHSETRTVVAKHGNISVTLSVGSEEAYVNDQLVKLEVPAKIADGRTLVPLRFVSEALGAQVQWDESTRTINIARPSGFAVQKPEGADTVAPPQTLTVEDIIEQSLPATVMIQTDLGLGSGFFVSTDGTVVTNHHVIADASTATVITNDHQAHAVIGILAQDLVKDVAILKTEAVGYPTLSLAVNPNVRAGQSVIAIGSPLGLGSTVSTGIVSNPERVLDRTPYIQHTAPISSGSSGGPLLNMSGEVIGVNTALISGEAVQNINFAISSQDVTATLAKQGTDVQPLLSKAQTTTTTAQYRQWLVADFENHRMECRAKSELMFDAAGQQRYGTAKNRAQDVVNCYNDLAWNMVWLEPPTELKLGHFYLLMAMAYNSATYRAQMMVMEYANQGLFSSAVPAQEIVSDLMFVANWYWDLAQDVLW